VDASCSNQQLADAAAPAGEVQAAGTSSSLEGAGRQASRQLTGHKEVSWLPEHDPGGVQSEEEDPAIADSQLLQQLGSIAGSRHASAQMPDVLGTLLHMEGIAEGEQLQSQDRSQQQLDDRPEQTAAGDEAGEELHGQEDDEGSAFERLAVEIPGSIVPDVVEATSRTTTADARHGVESLLSHRPVATSGIAYTVVTSTWANSPAAKQPAASTQDEAKEAAAEVEDSYMAASIRAASRASQALQSVSAPQASRWGQGLDRTLAASACL
jgi:hypothetical protein